MIGVFLSFLDFMDNFFYVIDILMFSYIIHMDFLRPCPNKGYCPRINIDFGSFVLRCFQTSGIMFFWDGGEGFQFYS
jgi:hypothetical protein